MPRLACSLLAIPLFISLVSAAEPQIINVWPGKAPDEAGEFPAESDLTKPTDNNIAGRRLMRVGNVTTPTLAVYRPAAEKDTGAAAIIAPGGAYNILALDLEGTEVAEWLNTLGITGIVLKYRVPRRPGTPGDAYPVQPLQDAQRALSLVRSKAPEWKLNPQRIGLVGFSAGGHLAARAATNFEKRAYSPQDAVDEVSCRPDFLVLVYPAYLVTKDKSQLQPEIAVTKNTPPTFLAHAGDDPVVPESSALMYLALKQAGVPAELHIYANGGHGYGLRRTEAAVTSWPERCELWLQAHEIVPAKK